MNLMQLFLGLAVNSGDSRFALCRAYYDRSIRRSFECHSAPAVLRICAGVNDQFIAGLQSVSLTSPPFFENPNESHVFALKCSK